MGKNVVLNKESKKQKNNSPKGEKTIKVKLVKSFYGKGDEQIGTVRALGLKRINDVREHKDTPVIRGMIFKVKHLVEVLED